MPCRRLPSFFVLALVVAAVPAGCGDGGGALELGAVGRVDPNETDVAFVRALAPQRREAAEMARLGRKRAGRVELRQFARSFLRRGDQDLELGQLTREFAGRSPGRERMTRDRADPRRLRDAVSFDHSFMEMMIHSFEDAVAMAEVEQDRGRDPRVERLANSIRESGNRDLEALRRWLHTWYGESPVPGDRDGGGGGAPTDPPV